MSTFVLDLRQGLRALRLSPVFAATAVLTIGLGIGANTAIFSVVEAVVLRPLPFENPEELVLVHEFDLDDELDRGQISFPDYRDLAERSVTLEAVAAWEPTRPSLTGDDVEPVRLLANSVTHSLFSTLGVVMELGRSFARSDDQRGAAPVAVLSHRFWRDRFAASPEVLGQPLRLNGDLYTIVGVLPESLSDSGGGSYLPSSSAAVWLPWNASSSAEVSEIRGVHRARVVGRLADGVSIERANEELRQIASELAAQYPDSNTDQSFWVDPALLSMVGPVRSSLYLLFGAVGLVLLLVCSNVSGLLLGRAVGRRSEIAIRTALGAGRARLIRQLLTESLLLAALGGSLGVLLAWLLLDLGLALAPSSIPRLETAGLEPKVLLYSLAVAIVSSLLFGLAPAWSATRRDSGPGSRGARPGGRSLLRQGLVAGQVAAAVVLMIGAGLLLRSFWTVLEVDPGFRDEGLLGVAMELPMPFVSPEWPRAVRFYQEAVDRVAAMPGVVSAAAAYRHPLDAGWGTTFSFRGRPEPAAGDEPQARFRPVTPRYFETVGVSLLEGRAIDSRDVATAAGAVVVNRSFVERYFRAEESPIGAVIDYGHWWRAGPNDYQIVGVVEDVRYEGPGNDERRPALYFAHAQQPIVEMNLLVRHEGDAAALVPAIRKAIWEIDPEMPLDRVFEMSHLLDRTVSQRRFVMSLLVSFAAVALLLSALGLYGMLAFAVQQRRSEIGLRMALGASLRDVTSMVVRQGARLVMIGGGGGLVASLVLTRLLASQLYGVSRHDPVTLAAVPALLAGVALLASWLPARRAARLDPVTTLREE